MRNLLSKSGTCLDLGYGFRRSHSERRTKDGAVLVTHNQLLLLHGLLDRPKAAAVTYVDWVDASMPYLRCFARHAPASRLFKSILRLPDEWVTRTKTGHCWRCQLTLRGWSLLDGSLPAQVFGHGTYRGLRALGRSK